MQQLLIGLFAAVFAVGGFSVQAQENALKTRMTGAALEWSEANGRFRQAMEAFPKGADLHSHLRGAVYAESWLEWAAEDGLCVDLENRALRFREKAPQSPQGKTCETSGWITVAQALEDEDVRRSLINAMSTRSYVPTLDWSGHNDFFDTFNNIQAMPYRLGDQLAEVAARAGHQNILYLELMETIVLPELFPLVADLELTGDVAADHEKLMASPFGSKVPELIASIRSQLDEAYAKKDRLLGCAEDSNAEGCDVEIRFIHQVIRSFPPEMVYAQIALGWQAIQEIPQVVALNLVAPEDGHIALRDYSYHMRMIDHLYRTEGARNVTLHAGELTLGLVRPKQLRFHIREAIELGHAKRIGHGIDIAFEDDSEALLEHMAREGIMVEINLTSNDTILGVSGRDHPIVLYRDKDVPYALSTDDEGVSRIDLTHEYMRYMREHKVPYLELKYASRNSLTYSFLEGASLWDSEACTEAAKTSAEPNATCGAFLATSEKARLQWELEKRFRQFEDALRIPERKKTSFK